MSRQFINFNLLLTKIVLKKEREEERRRTLPLFPLDEKPRVHYEERQLHKSQNLKEEEELLFGLGTQEDQGVVQLEVRREGVEHSPVSQLSQLP